MDVDGGAKVSRGAEPPARLALQAASRVTHLELHAGRGWIEQNPQRLDVACQPHDIVRGVLEPAVVLPTPPKNPPDVEVVRGVFMCQMRPQLNKRTWVFALTWGGGHMGAGG